MKEKNKVQLGLAIGLIIISILFTSIIQTRFGTIKMTEVSLETDAGTLKAYLFKPQKASADNPAPCIILSHGYLNNKEMQDANYIELARRGYVVIAMDAYGHGDSDVADEAYADTDRVKTGGMIDWVYYAAELEYVDETQIGVCGHSLGGSYANLTMKYFTDLERSAQALGLSDEAAHEINLVNTGVIIGNYPDNILTDTPRKGYLCNIGIILSQNDEFFYEYGKDLLTSEESRELIRYHAGTFAVDTIEEGEFYTSSSTGYSIVFYNPGEFHATNHFSYTVVKEMLDIFDTAMPSPRTISSANQVWIFKEICNLLGLVGFFLSIVPIAELLLSLKPFSSLKASAEPAVKTPKYFGSYVFYNSLSAFLCFLLIIPLFLLGYLMLKNIVLPQDTTGGIGLWSAACGLILLLFTKKLYGKKFKDNKPELGLTWSWKALLVALLLAIAVFLPLFLAKWIGNTDFRIWTFDVRAFSVKKIWVALRYLPLFFPFYLAQSLSLSRSCFNTWSERKQLFIGALWNTAPVLLMLLVTYLPALFGGATLWNLLIPTTVSWGELGRTAMALIPILLLPFVPLLAITSRLSLKLYKLTGNVWLGAVFNTLLVTLITVSNTSFSYAY